jgi:polyisoprenoid-binding protein YceI
MGDAVRYTPDRWHTRIYFTISHMGLSNYQGRFIDYEFDFMANVEELLIGHFLVQLGTESVYPRNRHRNFNAAVGEILLVEHEVEFIVDESTLVIR